ncbi:hypothetical protein [Rhizorhabdus sp. FW153]|uniref:hypothetical protein n=1 Tax=Rhizorhabdus sp. FW153 TaxID=3400216 RepID=UPI003CF38743
MDATSSSSDNGFDAALKALEDLETSISQSQEDNAANAAPADLGGIDLDQLVAESMASAAVAAEPVVPPAAAAVVAPVDAAPVPGPSFVSPALVVSPGIAFAEEERSPTMAVDALPDIDALVTQLPPIAPPVTMPAPADGQAEAAPPVRAGARAGLWTKVAIGLGLLSSVVSAAGLIIAERVVSSASLVVADARERQHQLEQANKLIADLQLVRDKQIELLKAQQAQLASAPVTSEELQHRMEALQAGLIQRDPVREFVQAVRESQMATNSRFQEVGMKLERIEAMAARQAH